MNSTRRLAAAMDALLGLLMLLLFILVCSQVFSRYLLNFSFAWSEELPTLLYVWLVYLGFGMALAEGRHLGVTLLQDALPFPLRRALRCLVHLSILGFLLFTVVAGWVLVGILGYYEFGTLPFSRYWLFLAVPVGSLIAIPIAVRALTDEVRGDRAITGGSSGRDR
jgi:TRAP-type C4-dicarboxylate transport system permease small subunit